VRHFPNAKVAALNVSVVLADGVGAWKKSSRPGERRAGWLSEKRKASHCHALSLRWGSSYLKTE